MTRASLNLAFLGDLCFEGWEADGPDRPFMEDFAPLFKSADLVIGNLECPLLEQGTSIPGKCSLRGSTAWAHALRRYGIGMVSLANNHSMDYGEEGLASTIAALDAAGIVHVGAGPSAAAARAGRLLTIRGRTVALLARTAVFVAAPTAASDTAGGVALLDEEETLRAIIELRARADVVILLIHWGVEEYLYPSPGQRRLAAKLAEAGVDAVVGHHPHVIQGWESISNTIVLYSLGNFVFREFAWTYISPDGTQIPQWSPLSAENRKAVAATVQWNAEGRAEVKQLFARINPDGSTRLDRSPARVREFRRRSARLRLPGYAHWWKTYAWAREFQLRVLSQVSLHTLPRKLLRIRPHHLRDLITALRRSRRIVSETSTNFYE
jgi:hypothetical protein